MIFSIIIKYTGAAETKITLYKSKVIGFLFQKIYMYFSNLSTELDSFI